MTISDDLTIMAETITVWESESRCGGSFSMTKSEIERGIQLFEELVQMIEKQRNNSERADPVYETELFLNCFAGITGVCILDKK